jgi:cell division protein FtsA
VARVEQDASLLQLGDNREILDITTRSFILGGQANIKNPIGMSGLRLEVDSYVISGLTPHISNLEKVLDLTELPRTTIIPSGLAAAQIVLGLNQKENGVACVDIGGTTTNIVVYDEGELYQMSILPVGSNAITNDLAIGLQTDLEIAEKVKTDYAVALASERKTGGRIKIMSAGETHYFETDLVDKIVEARCEEIFELINLELRKIDRYAKLPGGVVLTGGGAELSGVTACAKEIMRLNARVGKPPKFAGMGDQVASPAWSTALGLMVVDIKDDLSVNKPRKPKKSLFGRKKDKKS